MATGVHSVMFGRRNPNRVDPGMGVIEEGLGKYSGTRLKYSTVGFGAGFSSRTLLVNAQTVSGGSTPTEDTPINVTRASEVNPSLGGLSYSLAVHNSAGPRDYRVRAYGFNQFGKFVNETITWTQAPISATTIIPGTRIFSRLTAVQVVARNLNGTPTGNDTLSVGPFNTDNPRIGLPFRINEPNDLISFSLVGYSGVGVGVVTIAGDVRNSIVPTTFDLVENSFQFPINWAGGGMTNEGTGMAQLTLGVRTSLGMTLGVNQVAGQKFIYQR